jgi:hypothetical protein
MILQKDHLTEVAFQVHSWEGCLLVGYSGGMDATLNCTFSFIRQQYLSVVLPIRVIKTEKCILLPFHTHLWYYMQKSSSVGVDYE